tara:strand:+ start:2171 stop:3595 length:1425 start_codon:yes stop_codon:yes gene_type:complete
MKKINKKFSYLAIFLTVIFFILGVYLISQDSTNTLTKKIKDNTPYQIKNFLKKTIFFIPIKNRENKKLKAENEKLKKKNRKLHFESIKFKNKLDFGKANEKIINSKNFRYQLNEFILPFYSDDELFDNDKKGYLEIYNNKLLVFFGSGKSIIIDIDKLNNNIFEYRDIKNNIKSNKYFDTEIKWAGVKDIKVDNNNLYLSLTKALKKDCYTTSLLVSKIDLDSFKFNEIIFDNQCTNSLLGFSTFPSFKNFNGYQNGGRIVTDEKNIFLTIGDYNMWDQVQLNNSIFGKIIKIDKSSFKSKKISKGHRNQQGMYNLDNSKIIVTEHGPKGGDEINLVNTNSSKILNYGWPISSYGEHYDSVPLSKEVRKIAPLNKNHKDFGFVEPLFYFKDSIGISEIIKNHFSEGNNFFISSLKNKTIYNIEFDLNFENPKITDEIIVGERIRDIIYDKKNKRYFLYLEGTPKLSILQKLTVN